MKFGISQAIVHENDSMNIPVFQRCVRAVLWGFLVSVVPCAATNLLPGFASAQDIQPAVSDNDRASLVRATRIMRKVDKNGDGTFGKSEDEAASTPSRRTPLSSTRTTT